MTPARSTAKRRTFAPAVAFLVAAAALLAQEEDQAPGEMPNTLDRGHMFWIGETLTKYAPDVLAAFAPVISNATPSVATVLSDGEPVALGTVVAGDGLLLTKASRLDGEGTTCRLPDGRHLQAAILARNDAQDLALLKIAATNLTPVAWHEGDAPAAGHWIVTPGVGNVPVAVGVVSAAPRSWRMRRRDKPRGFLGVQLEPGESNTVRVVRVIRGLAAQEAGIEAGDIVTNVDEEEMDSVERLIRKVGGTPPDTTIAVGLRRRNESLSVNATLGTMPVFSHELRWGGGPFSERRFEFPSVLPHDTVLLPDQCGGPLLDMEGRAVGINIARALRVASYALPAPDVGRVLAELKAQAPAGVEVSAELIGGDRTAVVPADTEEDAPEPNPEDDADARLVALWVKAVHDADADAIADLTEKLIRRYPKRKAHFLVRAAEVFLAVVHDHDRGYEIADRLMAGEVRADAEQLNELSWFIFTDDRLKTRDIERGMKLARLAVKRSRGRDAAILDTLARGHVEQGDLDDAIKTQKRALKRARGSTRLAIKETLDRYTRARHRL